MPSSIPLDKRINTGVAVADLPDIPTGMEFSPSGFVAPWESTIQYVVQVPVDSVPGASRVRPSGEGRWRAYFASKDQAVKAAKEHEAYAPQETWVFHTAVKSVLNITDASRFTEPDLFNQLEIRTFKSKQFAAFQLIALPRAVHSAAVQYGLDVPDFSLEELTSDSTIFNDEFQFKMTGHPDATPDQDLHYTRSILWLRRAALWAALGEPDPFRYARFSQPGGEAKFKTGDNDLNVCLEGIYPWKVPQWARIVSVNDPRVDAKLKSSGNRLKIPVIFDWWKTEAEARAAVGNDEESKPVIPEAWAQMPESFEAEFKKAIAEGLPMPVLMKRLAASESLILAWRAHLKV